MPKRKKQSKKEDLSKTQNLNIEGEEKGGDKKMEDINLITLEAMALHMYILEYLILAEAPLYEHIVVFRKRIDALQNEHDKEQMKAFFEQQFSGPHTEGLTAWEYYKPED